MIELDGDEERISSQGRLAERDIVQVGHPGTRAGVERVAGPRDQGSGLG